MTTLDATLDACDTSVRRMLDGVLDGGELAVNDAIALCEVQGAELAALLGVANALRERQCGDVVTYVVNRNVNFTNLCVKSCKFCAFSRTGRSEEGYFLDEEEVVRRALEAQRFGATEVCVQAGLPPRAKPTIYLDLLRALKRAAPELHVHAFSPEEVKYGAQLMGLSTRDYLAELKAAGIGSLPGTSAEILDDRVRKRLAGGRITTAEWIDVITSAHALGIPTTATIMHGHIETHAERMQHLALLRSLQKDTRGFTEIVPLSFVHAEAPLTLKHMLPDVRPGPTQDDVLRTMALTRLVLGETFRNVQTSWVKEGLVQATAILGAGANDLGGTLMNESISTSAGALHGQLMRPRDLHAAIRGIGRVPAQRNTRYELLRRFDDAAHDPHHPLDDVHDATQVFGSYAELTRKARASRQARETESRA